MPRGRYDKLKLIDGTTKETFTLDKTSRFKAPDTFDDISTFEYTVKVGDRLDHLAAKFLNDDRYWWVIALVSNKVSPFLTPNEKIRIPFDVSEVLDRI